MAIRSVGINQPWSCPNGLFGLAGDLESLKGHGADFVELMPAELGVILGGDLDPARLRIVQEQLLEADPGLVAGLADRAALRARQL